MNKFKRILIEGLELSMKGLHDGALSKWKKVLKEEVRKGDERHVAQLYRLMSVSYEQKGESLKAKQSYLKSMKYRGKADPSDYYWLGLLSNRLGQLWAADRYFTKCEKLAQLDKEEFGWLLEILAKAKE